MGPTRQVEEAIWGRTDRHEGHTAPPLPISHLHTTPGLPSSSSISTQSLGLASISKSVLRG